MPGAAVALAVAGHGFTTPGGSAPIPQVSMPCQGTMLFRLFYINLHIYEKSGTCHGNVCAPGVKIPGPPGLRKALMVNARLRKLRTAHIAPVAPIPETCQRRASAIVCRSHRLRRHTGRVRQLGERVAIEHGPQGRAQYRSPLALGQTMTTPTGSPRRRRRCA